MAVVFPYEFDTSDVWRTIIKGVFALNTVIIAALLYSVLISHQWVVVAQLALIEATRRSTIPIDAPSYRAYQPPST